MLMVDKKCFCQFELWQKNFYFVLSARQLIII